MPKSIFAHLMGRDKVPAPAASASAETSDDEKDKEKEEGEGDDADEGEKDAQVQTAIREAVTAERERCASIFALPAAANNIAQAAELAFNTNLTAEQAGKVLGTAPKPATKDRLATAMAERSPNLGTDRAAENQTDDKTASAGWDRAVEHANKALGTRK